MNLLFAFIIVLGPTILFHELGHFLVAKAVGIKVHEFALGFGPAIGKRRRGETVYSLRSLPLGGFVKLAGMDIPEDEADMVAADDEGSFNNKPLWQRMAVIAAGPVMNFLLAILLFAGYMAVVAIPPTVQLVSPGSPAAQAGILPGDEIVSVAGEKIETVADVTRLVGQYQDQTIPVVVRRDGVRKKFLVTPRFDPEIGRPRLGVSIVEKRRQPMARAVLAGIERTYLVTRDILRAVVRMVTGRMEPDIAGPIGIFQLVGESAQRGLVFVVFIAAVLSVNLGLFNFLPVPVLDGGWLLLLALEAVRGQPLKPEQRGIVQFIGLAFLLLLMLFATYKDLLRLDIFS